MDWAELFKTAGFETAAFTAAAAAVGWLGAKVYGWIDGWFEAREKERIAIVRFYADVRLRVEGLAGLFDPQALTALEHMIRAYEAEGRIFRMYGTQVSDIRSQERMNLYLHKFPSDDAYLIRKYILYDRMMVIEYDKLQSDAFQALNADRKVAALKGCAETAKALKEVAEEVQAMIEGLSAIRNQPDIHLPPGGIR